MASQASYRPTAVPSSRRVVTVRLFARYADLLGTDRLEVPADNIKTVGDLLAAINALPGGRGAAVARTALVAVNLTQARPETVISPTDEIALLPPLAGG